MAMRRIAHVNLKARKLDEAVAFYSDGLGLERVFDFKGRDGHVFGCYLRLAPDSYIEIFEEPTFDGKAGGIAHFCLEVDDMAQTVKTLRERGVAVTDPKLGADQSWQAWITDPSGNRFELHQYTAASSQRTGATVKADWH